MTAPQVRTEPHAVRVESDGSVQRGPPLKVVVEVDHVVSVEHSPVEQIVVADAGIVLGGQ